MPNALVLFMKAPRPGTVKTRLTSQFSMTEASNLYRAFIKDTVYLSQQIIGVSVYVAWTPANSLKELKDALGNPEVHWLLQHGSHLGERLSNTFKRLLKSKTQKTIIIGGDSPLLPSTYIEEAFRSLDRNDVVLGPAIDGGYYLIGLGHNRKVLDHCTNLFEPIDWGTSDVLDQTRMAIRKYGLSCHELAPWFDIDRPADLDRVVNQIRLLRADGDQVTGTHTESEIKKLDQGSNTT